MVELIDPKSPLTKAEELVFGVDAVRHPLLGIPIGRQWAARRTSTQLAAQYSR
jgi:hypothetical protein